jgi:RNA ligase (TIGR02306 family)
MERELVKVLAIESLENADNSDSLAICKLKDSGWQCVVRREEFEVGEQVIYIEIDSVLPMDSELFTFLTKGEKNYRLRTIKLRSNLSQGLVIKIPDGMKEEEINAETLGIVKYEPEMKFSTGQTAGLFPSYILQKTDQERIQNVKCILSELSLRHFYKTLKMDGTSSTFLYINDEFTCCSHNFRVTRDDSSVYWKIANKYDLENKLKNTQYAIQGEICGPNIQKNTAGLDSLELFVFDVYDTISNKYLHFGDAIRVCESLDLKVVENELLQFDEEVTIDYLLEIANNSKYRNGHNAEGLVYRTFLEEWHRKLGRFSFKVISNNYLLKEDKN